ncbi:MAG TPA: EamA family transporter [bacterium]|nr:EamA family transporter [bacterium]HMW34837.1 EamA family transporter [bacterium]HMY34756.1 EamA family transporter [bacterium]HMZ03376.1 EamA family transporter [bacterium]HNB07986.1 EamA family transporter [bacterium]
MRDYVLFAVLAGLAWGLGGYFEKSGLRAMGIPPIAGITLRTGVAFILLALLSIPAWKQIANVNDTTAWVMIIIGGGVVAGSLGMWSFYKSLSTTENLGVTLALAFSISPIAGTVMGLFKGNQPMNWQTGIGLVTIIIGIIILQTSHAPTAKP